MKELFWKQEYIFPTSPKNIKAITNYSRKLYLKSS